MGKNKGKNSGTGEGGGKGSRNDWQRSLSTAITTARYNAYDQHALAKKQESLDLISRKPKRYLFLRNLLESRVHDDCKEKKGDVSWISSLTATSFSKQNNEEKERNTQRMIQETQRILQCAYTSTSFGSTIVPSLAEIALETIACNIDRYDINDLKRVLKSLPPQSTELLSVLATENDTLNNDNIQLLSSNTNIRSLTLGGLKVSDEGIIHLATLFSHLNSHYQWDAPDDWEDSLLLQEEDCELVRHVRLKQLTLMNLGITLQGFQSLQFSMVEELIVHNFEFHQDRTKSSFDHTSFDHHSITDSAICDIFFGKLDVGFPFLKKLTLSYCTWCTVTALLTIAGGDYFLQKLPYLRDLVITGVDVSKSTGAMDNNNESLKADIHLLTSIFTFNYPQITLHIE